MKKAETMSLRSLPPAALEESVAGQMEIGAELSDGYVSLITGDISRVYEFDSKKEEAPLIASGQIHLIPTITSQDLYLWMVEFASLIEEQTLQEELEGALESIGAVWKFRNILYHQPELSEEWERFKHKKLIALAKEWIEYVTRIPADR